MKVLIVIDMQNDFITGSLANPAAEAIVKPIVSYINNYDGDFILATRDTHHDSYLNTYEGEHLPIKHCVYGTDGWQVNWDIMSALKSWKEKNASKNAALINKPYFGYAEDISIRIFDKLDEMGKDECVDEIEFVGTVTEICVISNVLGLKPYFPDADFIVHSDMCAGLTKEAHEAALTVMRSCQVKVV